MSKELEKAFKELNNECNNYIDNQKKELAKHISETYFNWKKEEEAKGKKFNQKNFAKLIGCSQPRVSNMIQGKVDKFTLDKLMNFAYRLGMTPKTKNKSLKNMKNETRTIIEMMNETKKIN